MKKILFAALGAGLLLTSCQSDEPFAPGEGGEKQVSFTLSVQETMGTRAGSGNNSAVGGVTNNQGSTIYYTLALYNGETLETELTKVAQTSTVEFNPTVILGRNYTVVAYANLEGVETGLTEIGVTKKFNDEGKDAYFVYEDKKFTEGDLTQNLTLTRPFGKLRLVATDYAKLEGKNAVIDKVTVDYANELYTLFNAKNGEFSTTAANSYTWNWTDIYYTDADGEKTIFADYIPVPANGEYACPFTITVNYKSGETFTREFTQDIPVKRNGLTTLKGDFFTANATINVTVENDFEGAGLNIPFTNVLYDGEKTAEENGTALFNTIMNGPDGCIYHLQPGVYKFNDGETSRYNNKSFTIIGEDGTVFEGAKYGMVIQDSTDPNSDMVVNLKNITIRTNHDWAAALYVKYNIVVNVENVKLESKGETALLLDNCNAYDGDQFYVREDRFGTTVNVKDLTIDQSDFIEFNSNPCNAYPTKGQTYTYFNFEGNCNFGVANCRPQSVNKAHRANFVNGEPVENPNGLVAFVGSTGFTTLSAALNAAQNGDEVEIKSGEYKCTDFNAANKTLTLRGVDDDVVIFVNQNNAVALGTFDGSKITFENLTIKTTSGNYKGFARMEGTYSNCKFENLYFMNQGKHVFDNCTFNSNNEEHCIWTYGGEDIEFNNCEFTYGDRAVNCYKDPTPNHETIAKFTNCKFTKVAGKATTGAIETNSSSIKSLALYLTNCTVNEGDLWWISTYDSLGGANTTVFVDGVQVHPELIVFIGQKGYASLDAALKAAKNGDEVVIKKAGEYHPSAGGGKKITVTAAEDGVIFKLYNEGEAGCDYGFGSSSTGVGTYTFNNITFNTTGNTGNYKGYAYMGATYNDCKFVGAWSLNNANTFAFNNCEFDFLNGYFWTWSGVAVSFNGCTFKGNSKAILAHGYENTEININNCTFAATEKGYTSANDNTACVEIDPAGSNKYTINFTGSNTKTDSYAGWTRVKDGSTGHTITGVN